MTGWKLARLGEPEFPCRQILASLNVMLKLEVDLDPRHKSSDLGQDGDRDGEDVEHPQRHPPDGCQGAMERSSHMGGRPGSSEA